MKASQSDFPLQEAGVGQWGGRGLSRREFAALSVGACVSMAALTPAAAGMPISETDVHIKMPVGTCDAALIRPQSGAHPGVLLWPDAPSLREALRGFGRRLAGEGYTVLIPNIYYRAFKAPLWDGPINLGPEFMGKLQSGMKTVSPETSTSDAKGLMAFLEAHPSVSNAKMGLVGYCAGGAPVMRTAALFPERIGAAAIFHGGGLATDRPDSPHLLIPKMKARFYLGIAAADDLKEPSVKDTLRAAFDAQKIPATMEVYAGMSHGWTIPDFPPMNGESIYKPAEAERAWAHLLTLYKSALI